MKGALLFIFFAVARVAAVPIETSEASSKSDTCVSKECIGTAHLLFNRMNLSADPCDNFFEFGCGGFVAETAIPDDKSRWSSFDEIAEEIYIRGRLLLEEQPSSDDFESYQLARDYYQSCIDEDQRELLGVEPMKEKLKEFGGWPVLEGESWSEEESFKWWEFIYKLNKAGFGINSIVSFSMSADDKNSSWNVITFDQASLGMSREYLIKGFDDQDVQKYYNYMVETSILFGADPDTARQELKDVLQFEISLANINAPKEERRNATVLYNPTTLGALPNLEGLPSWTEYVQNILEDADSVTIDDSEKIVLTNVDYFNKLSTLLKETKPRVVANYLCWRATSTVMTYLNKAAESVKQNYDKAVSGTQQQPPTWKRCTNVVGFNSNSGSFSLGLVAGSMYVRRYFDEEAKKSMLEMSSYIRKAFKDDILEEIEWMDEITKGKAKQKLDAMDEFIGYSEEFIDKSKVDDIHKGIEVVKDRYLDNALNIIRHWRVFNYNKLRVKIDPKSWLEHPDVSVVNAYYYGGANNIEFPAGILQGAFFNAKIPKYMNFGAIGAVIGHEITHGFDDKGKQRNGVGEIENWWQPETETNFKKNAQCIIDQYSNYVDPQVGQNLNGVANQGENIADNGGVKEAYKAYLHWLADHEEEPQIVGFSYTPKQMFWISFSQVWCVKYRNEALSRQIITGAHSPSHFRVIGSLSNNADFAKDFNCPIGSKMNPEKKCAVW